MARFGCYNPFAATFGGDIRPVETVHRSLNEFVGRVLNVTQDSVKDHENYALAIWVGNGWEANARLAGQGRPNEMYESLPIFEELFVAKPGPKDNDVSRRAVIAGKLRGFSGNDVNAIRDTCANVMGRNFVEISKVPPESEVVYIPGILPGPPGLETHSNTADLFVQVTKDGIDQEAFDAKVEQLYAILGSNIPSWMGNIHIFVHDTNGVDDGFILDLSLLDEGGL